MIVHVVLFRPRAELTADNRSALAEALSAALRDIPSIRRARVGRRVMHGRPYEGLMHVDYSHAAFLEFDDLAGLQAYLQHPAHDRLAGEFFQAFAEALMYDFELEEGETAVRGLV